MKTPEEFKKQASLKGINYWPSHNCSMCGESVGTEIYDGQASYRSSYGCSWTPNHNYGWEKVTERYNS